MTISVPRARAIVDAPKPLAAERKIDPGRHPAELLNFLELVPGMRVAGLAAGAGHTAELLARGYIGLATNALRQPFGVNRPFDNLAGAANTGGRSGDILLTSWARLTRSVEIST
jgi:hypothetical protein